ncbi:hypothetical protein R6Q57_021504 [Mikania cordata]
MEPYAWVQFIMELSTTPTNQKQSQTNLSNPSKQFYGCYHGTRSYVKGVTLKSKKLVWQSILKDGERCIAREALGKIMGENNKLMSSSGGDDMVNEAEILEWSLGQSRGHNRCVGQTFKSVTPDIAPSMYAPHGHDLKEELIQSNAYWKEQQEIIKGCNNKEMNSFHSKKLSTTRIVLHSTKTKMMIDVGGLYPKNKTN